MKFRFFKHFLFLLYGLIFVACQEKVPDLQAISTFYPNSKRLNKGIVNKYYFHSKANKSYDTATDIRYISYRQKEDKAIQNNIYNPGYEPMNARNLIFKKDALLLKEELNYERGKVIKTQILDSTFLSFEEDAQLNEKRKIYDWGEVFFKDQQQIPRDTTILNQPAKIFVGKRFINSSYDGNSYYDTLNYKFIYAKDIGLWSSNYEDKNGKFWMELIEQIPIANFNKMVNHGRHRIAYIDPTKTLDNNPDFKICHQDVADYYNHEKGHQPILRGGKSAMNKILAERVDDNKLFTESGYLTLRFVINCEGEAGRFTTEQTDLAFQAKVFNQETVDHFYDIIKDIKDWRKTIIRDEPRDAYAYITFKLKDGKVIELLP